jgi:hypothetical protein
MPHSPVAGTCDGLSAAVRATERGEFAPRPSSGSSTWSVVVSYIIFGIGAAAAVLAVWSYKRLTAGRTRGGRRW